MPIILPQDCENGFDTVIGENGSGYRAASGSALPLRERYSRSPKS